MTDWPPFRTAYLQEFPDAGTPVELAVVAVAPAALVVSAAVLPPAAALPPVVQVAAPAVMVPAVVHLPVVGELRLL